MGIVSGIVVYTCLWWIIFFMALPFGIEAESVVEKGSDPGAPKKPYLFIKLVITTILSTICWLGVNYAINHDLIQFVDRE